MIASFVLLPLLLAGAVPDDVVLIRIDPDKAQKQLWVDVHRPSTEAGKIYGTLDASDHKFEKAGGKKPVRHVFAAQWDGAGLEELVVVREHKKKADRRLELRVYGWPAVVGGNTGAVLAKSSGADLGSAAGDGRIVALGPIDADGDHKDEVMVVREALDGRQWFEIRALPAGKNKLMGAPLLSDQTFGQAGSDATVSLFGSDVDGDEQQDIVALRRGTGVPDRLLVFHLPAQVNGETGEPFRSDLDVSPADLGQIQGIWRQRSDLTEKHRALFLIEGPAGAQRLELCDLPPAVGSDIGAPLLAHGDMKVSGATIPVFGAFGARDGVAPPEPWELFQGEWQASFWIVYKDGSGGFIEEWLGPFPGVTGTVETVPFPYLTLEFPPGTTYGITPIEGYVTGWDDGNQALFALPGTAQSPQVWYYPPIEIGIITLGDYIDVTYPWGTISRPEGQLPVIQGGIPDAGAPYIGNIWLPDNVTAIATVFAYKFERVP
ncbi:MAG: hypothetical protein HY812_05365 [Planctomycetes bacterium]|nr:hypothetical protein [Planctomycetota bacterium]